MKKTLLISTAFFLSAASFAQTKVNNTEALKGKTSIQNNNAGTQMNSSENASSATTIHSGIVKNAKDGSTAKIKEENQAMAAKKQAIAAKAKDKGQQAASIASQDRSASASTKSNAKVHASAGGNNLDGNSSMNSSNTVSTVPVKNKIGKLKSAEKESVHATMKDDNRSQVVVNKTAVAADHKIKTSSAAGVKTSEAIVQKVHVKPLRVETGAHVKTAAGIRIR
jgi:hypothetical protein